MDLRDLLTIEVLEQYVSDMIIDNIIDMEEIIMGDIHIRKTHQRNYKIYEVGGEEIFFNTHTDYNTEDMKQYENCFLDFVKAFINAMKNSDRLDNVFIQEILIEMIIYSFIKNKDSIYKFVQPEDVEQYIQLGLNDGLEDIIFRSQTEQEIKDLYSDYIFSYIHHSVVVEEDDLVDLQYPDQQWIEQNGWRVGNDINEDNFIIENNDIETQRFKNYLESRGELIKIEKIAIKYYLEHLIYPYQRDFINFIGYIIGEDLIETTDDEADMIMD